MKVLATPYGISCSLCRRLRAARVDAPTGAVFGATRTPAFISNEGGLRAAPSVASDFDAWEQEPTSPGGIVVLTSVSRYSIVIPAYNESERLGPTLDRVLAFVRQQMLSAEIVVVNDGSTDETAALVQNHRERSGGMIRLVENPENRGKGYSVRNGVLHSAGDIVLFTDADLSAPIEEAVKLIDALNRGADIAIGSRWARRELQTRRQSLARQILGRVFNRLLQLLLSLKFKDTQCGFKAFRREAARVLFPLQRIEGWGFDAEILFLAKKSAFQVAEVPVVWGHDSRKLAFSHCGTVGAWLPRCSAFAGTG
jgi:dolichyl-phosphate beta-glucosyltransferase